MNKEEQDNNDLTLEEKASFLRGVGNWNTYSVERKNIKSVRMSDGPIGVRKEKVSDGKPLSEAKVSVCMPSGALLCSSFDRKLAYEFGKTLGEESKAYAVNILLGPAINIKRSPLGGRGFEYYSEDPLLAGTMGSSYINGLQSQGIGASLKHYCCNSQETGRMNIDEIIDYRALHEIYLKAFEIAVKKSQPYTVMVSYNKVNGFHTTESQELLTDILRTDWGYKGVTISDWGAVFDPIASVKAGLDIEMPCDHYYHYQKVLEEIRKDKDFEHKADESVSRIIELNNRCSSLEETGYDFEKDHQFSKEAACDSIILLKNEKVLPLKKNESLAIIGPFAANPRYQGGGSSHITSYKEPSFLETVSKNGEYDYIFAQGYDLVDEKNENGLEPAVKASKGKDKVIIFLGIPETLESEGIERASMSLPDNQLKLVKEISKVNKNIIVVLMNGGPLEMPFVSDVAAILETYLGGEAVNEAIYDILTGKVNPSGHLAETFPLECTDNPSSPYFPGDHFNVQYKESIYVGYRYYTTACKKVLYPFGYGLSYSEFAFSDLAVIKTNDSYQVKFKVLNKSDVVGKAVPQIYIGKPSDIIFNAKRELCGYEKVELQPGEEKEIIIDIPSYFFTYFNIRENREVSLFGKYVISLGYDVDTIVESKEIEYKGTNLESPYDRNKIDSYFKADISAIDDETFKCLFKDGTYKLSLKDGANGFDTSFRQAALKGSKGAKAFIKIMSSVKGIKDNKTVFESMLDAPVRFFIYLIPALAGKNEKHIYAVLNDHFWLYHLVRFFLIVSKSAKDLLE